MPQRCSITGCRSNSKEGERVTVFSIPKKEPQRTKWLQNIPKDCIKKKNLYVCVKHFDNSYIIKADLFRYNGELKEYARKIPKLAEGAVPTIFPDLTSHLKSDNKNIEKKKLSIKEKSKDKTLKTPQRRKFAVPFQNKPSDIFLLLEHDHGYIKSERDIAADLVEEILPDQVLDLKAKDKLTNKKSYYKKKSEQLKLSGNKTTSLFKIKSKIKTKRKCYYGLPEGICIKKSEGCKPYCVWATIPFPKGIIFGPWGNNSNKNKNTDKNFQMLVYHDGKFRHHFDGKNLYESNWLKYVNYAVNEKQANMIKVYHKNLMYYETSKFIPSGTELLVWHRADCTNEIKICDSETNDSVESDSLEVLEYIEEMERRKNGTV